MQQLMQQNASSMTSQQIAEMVGKRHDSVKRTIETLANNRAIRLPQIVDVKNEQGQSVRLYGFSGDQGRLDSITVVAQLSPTFTSALVKRWDELERSARPVMPALPQTFSEALLLAGTLQQKIEQDAPKVAHYDNIVDRHTLLNATQVGQKLGVSPQKINTFLDTLNAYNKSVKRSRVFNTWFIAKGLGELKQVANGRDQALFTLKGEAWIVERYKKAEAA